MKRLCREPSHQSSSFKVTVLLPQPFWLSFSRRPMTSRESCSRLPPHCRVIGVQASSFFFFSLTGYSLYSPASRFSLAPRRMSISAAISREESAPRKLQWKRARIVLQLSRRHYLYTILTPCLLVLAAVTQWLALATEFFNHSHAATGLYYCICKAKAIEYRNCKK